MMDPIRVLIADDEPPARSRLRHLLAPESEIEIAGETANGAQTVAAIRSLAPDLVFLDVQMPDLDGFGVVAEIGPAAMPTVVFVTAFDQYALRAFEACALDYLLKPFDDERFHRTLERAREEIRRGRLDGLCDKLRSLLADGSPSAESPTPAGPRQLPMDRLAIRSAGRVVFVDTADIDWIEGAGSYVRLHAGSRSYLLRDTLRHLESSLDPDRFLRIHRSAMVNRTRVQELRPRPHGESLVILRDGTELKLSRTYRDRLARLLPG